MITTSWTDGMQRYMCYCIATVSEWQCNDEAQHSVQEINGSVNDRFCPTVCPKSPDSF